MKDFQDFKIVRELYPVTKGSFWKRRKCPEVDFSRETAWSMTSGGEVTSLADAQACDAAVAAGSRVFALAKRRLPFSRTVSAVCQENEWTWNYVMSGEFEIADPPKFLRRWAAAEGSCGVDGIPASRVVAGLWTELESAVRTQMRSLHVSGDGKYTVAEIQGKDVVPLSAWRSVFENRGGCAVSVTYARFVSPDQECERRRVAAAEAQRRLEEQERHAYLAAVDNLTQEAEIEKIERERQLAQKEFEARQAELDAAIQRQKVDLEIYEKQQLAELEVKLMRAKNEEEIRKADALREGDATAAAATAEKIETVTSALNEVLARIDKAAQNLSAMGVAAENLSGWRPPSSISAAAARQYDAGSDRFASLLAGLGEQAQNAMVISWEAARKADGFATRDLFSCRLNDSLSEPDAHEGSASRRNVLRIGDRMTLRLRSARSGYLTLFNLGTSGNVTKIFPSAEFGTTENFIRAGRTYSLPGELMPRSSLQDGVWGENGPTSDVTGRSERVLAILTENPTELDANCLGEETGRAMTRGGIASVEESVSRLGDLRPGSWSFGYLEAWVKA